MARRRSKFARLSARLARSPRVRNPDALAASIGRRKHGKTKFARMSAAGRRRH